MLRDLKYIRQVYSLIYQKGLIDFLEAASYFCDEQGYSADIGTRPLLFSPHYRYSAAVLKKLIKTLKKTMNR